MEQNVTCYEVMLKILQARLQQFMNQERPDVQGRFRKCRGARDQIASVIWITQKSRGFHKKTTISASLTTLKPLTVWIAKNCGNFFQLTCLLRNLHLGQEAKFRTRHRTTDWFKIRERVCEGCILSSCLFNVWEV